MKNAIVFGASRGIGFAVLTKLINNGYKVIGTYNSTLNGEEIIANQGGIPYKCDISSENEVNGLYEYATKIFKKIDLVINNAGICLPQKFITDVSVSEYEKIFSVNVKGTFLSTKNAVSKMLFSGGIIMNVSSVFGLYGGSCEAVYSASKSAVIGLTKSVAMEIANSNLQICSLCFGLIDTDMNKHLTEEEKLEFVKNYGLKKVPSANDVANKIFRILQKEQNINGKIYKIYVGK